VELDRILKHSQQIVVDDLDWELAGRAGLTASERCVLAYFADIEAQTIVYLRDLLRTEAALEPEVMGFLSIWNYEEYFHGRALSRLLAACGCGPEKDRVARVRAAARPAEAIQALLGACISRLSPDAFAAVYMAWGASQELTTLRGYEELGRTTRNPVLRELCARIARQERRHFAWYYDTARERLSDSRAAQRLTRLALSCLWTPVGAAVKGTAESARVMATLFPGDRAERVARELDRRMGDLPGLAGVSLLGAFLERTLPAALAGA